MASVTLVPSGILAASVLTPRNFDASPHRKDDTPKWVTVYILGTGCCRIWPWQSHWAAAFDFGDGDVRIVEMTAINSRGWAWNDDNYTITDLKLLEGVQSLDEFEILKGYRKLRHEPISILTSTNDLYRRTYGLNFGMIRRRRCLGSGAIHLRSAITRSSASQHETWGTPTGAR